MDLLWLGVVFLLVLLTLGLIAVCDPPRHGEP